MTKYKYLLWFISLIILYSILSGNEVRLSPNQFWQKHIMPAVNIDDVAVYVISLDRTPERYAATKASLERVGLKPKRFSAVDGYLLKITDDKGHSFTGLDLKNGTYHLALDRKYNIQCPSGDILYAPNKHFKHLLTAGELGILCSQRGVWQDIITHGYHNALIFEDDVLLNSQFPRLFGTLLKNLAWNYDLLFMIYEVYKYQPSYKVARIINNDYTLKVLANKKPIWYLAAYLLSNDGAKKLFHDTNIYDRPIDHMVGKSIANGEINAYTVADQKYAMLQEMEHLSTITEMGRQDH